MKVPSFEFLLDIFYPPSCFFCKNFLKKRSILCDRCSDHINPIVSTTVNVTKKYSVKVFSISDYKDPIRSLILSKGSSDIVSSRKLGDLIWDRTNINNVDFDFIVPIPLHWTRFARRGFNQAEEMARTISQRSNKKLITILSRTKKTKRQSELSPENRFENVKNVFKLNVKDISEYKNKNLLIVDDLMTTGSTIKAAARALIYLKPLSISAVVASRVV